MLKHRLLFGILMAIVLIGLVLLDGSLDGSLTQSAPDKPVQGTILIILLALIAIPAQFELGNLIKQTGMHVFQVITIPASILLAAAFFLAQYFDTHRFFTMYILLVPAFSFLTLFVVQAIQFGSEGTIRNVSGSFFAIIYLGFLSMFVLGIRVIFGPWALLTFIFTVKGSDIGAYTLGRLFGKRKLCPQISPGKTWEGLAGAMLFGGVVSFGFSYFSGIIASPLLAVSFGCVFGVLGQLGDLIESMLKREAQLKDSASSIPGFGGLLDVLDSPLATAPLGFTFFYFYEHFSAH